MRIDLRLQSFQFCIAGEDAGFLNTDFGFVGVLDGENDVMRGDGEKVEKKTGAEDDGNLGGEASVESFKRRRLREAVGEKLCEQDPEEAEERGGQNVGQPDALGGALLNRSGFAGVPGGEADELVDEAERDDKHGGVEPAETAWHGHQINQD